MARFSQGFLSSLGRPAMTQSLFDLGAAIGGVPGQLQQRKQRREEAGMLAGLTPGSVEYNQAMAKIAQQRGELEKAAQFGTAAEQQTQLAKQQQAERTAIQNELQGFLQSKQFPTQMKKPALRLLRGVVAGDEVTDTLREQLKTLRSAATAPAGQNYVVVGNRVFDRNTAEFINPTEVAEELKIKDLEDIFTKESIGTYVKTGDRDDLLPITEKDRTQDQYVAELQDIDRKIETADKALGLVDKYFPLTYDITKYLPLTDSRQLTGYVDTLQANLAFDRLQKMRDESKTGGALGQVSNIELRLLKSSVAALDPGSKNFAEQLRIVRTSYEDFKNALLGKAPSGERYITKDGVLYYELDDGTFENLTEKAKQEAR